MYERTVCASKSDGIFYFHDVILAMHPSFEKFAVILKKGECRSKGKLGRALNKDKVVVSTDNTAESEKPTNKRVGTTLPESVG